MFLEMNRMKEEIALIKAKTGINTVLPEASGPKLVLGHNSGLALHKDARRFEQSLSSNGSFYFDLARNRESPAFRPPASATDRQQALASQERAFLQALQARNMHALNIVDSNAASLAQSAQSVELQSLGHSPMQQ